MLLKPVAVNFAEKWNTLEETVKGVLRLDKIPRDAWYARFNDIYFMCGAFPEPHADKLYDSTKLLLETHVHQLLPVVQGGGPENLLQNYYTYWKMYSESIKSLNSLYRYFNITKRTMAATESLHRRSPSGPKQMLVGELGLDVWERNMIVPLKGSMSKLLLDEYDKPRHNIATAISLDIIVVIINSLVEVQEFRKKSPLQLYHSYFETPFLEQSSEHFKLEATRLLQECTVSEYMVKVLEIMKEEGARSKEYLHESTYNKLQSNCRQHMVIDHLDFIHSESEAMIKEERIRDMRNIYLLLCEVKDGFTLLAKIFKEHIRQLGINVVESLKQNQIYVHFVEDILNIHSKYKTIVVEVLNNNFSFSEALDTALTIIVNHKPVENQPTKAPEYLSKYCDKLLKKSYKGMSEAEIDYKLLQSITIFKYLDDKDIFQDIYQKYLARRLILQQCQSVAGEEGMINNLKQACGYEFTNKLHRMFTDIRISEGLNTEFHNEFLTAANDKLNLSFSTYVLQTGAWPLKISTKSSFVIPEQLLTCTQNFEKFYKEKYSGRELTWLHHQSQGELKLNYLPKMYLVTMQTFQLSIMLLFEDCNTLKYSEMNKILKLSDDQFKKHINSLVECKLLLLDGDNVSLNMEFTNRRTKLCITSCVQKDIPQEIEQTIDSVKDDRRAFLQATIIRIMKMRKTLGHTLLVNEIFSQSKSFMPSTTVIKRSIEILIDKGYLSRTPNLPDEYNYVA